MKSMIAYMGVALLVGSAALAAGCKVTVVDDGVGGSGSTSSSTKATSTSSTKASSTATTSTSGGGVGCESDPVTAAECPSCVEGPDQENCGYCCQTAEDAATTELLGYIVDECACNAGATQCATECAELCGGGSAAQTCITCLNSAIQGSAACAAAAETTCNGSATCTPLFDCFDTCPQ